MSTDHTARPESWARITEQAGWGDPYADLILEFSARVERLEQAQQQPAPSTPAGQGELVRSVAEAIRLAGFSGPYEPVQAAILAVADWFAKQGWGIAATMLRREVGR